uniref:Uncharacterized protein n=1 Tax=Trichuris muris TaxID=70415 RepID=A0A5S6QV85_TRIMR
MGSNCLYSATVEGNLGLAEEAAVLHQQGVICVLRSRRENKTRDSRRRPQSASVSQLQEPSVVAATFKGRRKKPDASPLFQPLSASSTGVRRSKRLKKEDKKNICPKNKKQE